VVSTKLGAHITLIVAYYLDNTKNTRL